LPNYYGLFPGWPDWANFRSMAIFYFGQIDKNFRTSPKFCVDYVLIMTKKCFGRHFGRFFHKFIWSPCLFQMCNLPNRVRSYWTLRLFLTFTYKSFANLENLLSPTNRLPILKNHFRQQIIWQSWKFTTFGQTSFGNPARFPPPLQGCQIFLGTWYQNQKMYQINTNCAKWL
jgi:hypothetical protein